MKLIVLTENCAGSGFFAEHGLSYIIEYKDDKILFDTGHSDIFIKNAKILGIDIQKEINTVILSHGHWDHGNGLQYIDNKTLITHPGVFIKRFRKNDNSNIGLKLSKNDFEQKFKLILKKEPYYISDNIVFLGQIPRLNDYESKTTLFLDELGKPDFVIDDSAIAVIQNNELIVITGCSHSGVCNIIEYARKVTGINKIKTVIGGFHLKHKNRQTKDTVNFLKKYDIAKIYPSHCTEFPALVAFYEHFNIEQLKTGMILNF
ncbi:MBL fold metallo-hydrolase [Flavivirga abyssicola]|uniref:MBL fold metallo-hydrolase n=1 Tax=Flavivirga abyssicola TaxID=3063533 RepID=UPI0026DF8A13|nr:MBL fold metallo-hydrolase [Flavivirga sp. MEBiC07777]WVK13580.1 MBL fold metallo-hydrolase [Flavivirga sp. MEBiC07777]